MALIVDQQPNFKHFCKICKKGFMCGRALGGHMRAHGIGDESGHIDEDDPASDWEDNKNGDNAPPGNKRMYALRTNPNRLKSCRICENCGKEFSSWKSFLEHGKCGSDDVESYMSSPESDDDDGMGGRKGCGWSKRKRSLRVKVADHNNNNNNNNNFNSNCPSSEEEDLANCLMMLSNARTTMEPLMGATAVEPEESCASASKDEERRRPSMNFMAPLSCSRPQPAYDKAKGVVASSRGLFECKACKKVFNSHQALGGHRASHKKVKGCFAARLDNFGDYAADEDVITHEEFYTAKPLAGGYSLAFDPPGHGSSNATAATTSAPSCSKRKSKVHECSICHRVFSSGQALGGHKRCHWITSNSPDASTSLVKLQHFHEHLEQIQQQQQQQQNNTKFIETSDPLALKLDLNLPVMTTVNEHGGGGGGGGVHCNISNPPGISISPDIYLQTWLGLDAKDREHNNTSCKLNHQVDNDYGQTQKHIDNENYNNDSNMTAPHHHQPQHVVDDEADSKVKLAKLSELKDINLNGGGSSSWLQVGIGSTADARAGK